MAIPASPALRIATAVLLLVAGAASIVFPFLSAAAVTLAFGAVAVAAGLSQLLRLGAAADLKARIFRLVASLLYVVGGLYVLLFPVDSTFSITLFLGALLVVEGVMELAAAAAAAGARPQFGVARWNYHLPTWWHGVGGMALRHPLGGGHTFRCGVVVFRFPPIC